MGNSTSSKDVGGIGGAGEGFGGYGESRTAPGAPGPFTDTHFATPVHSSHGQQSMDESGSLLLPLAMPQPGCNPNTSAASGFPGGATGDGMGDAMDVEAKDDEEAEEVVPTVFRWEHGGRRVYITGTFNNWEKQIPMHRSGNDFTYIHNLKKGKHAFKFIVDDEWRFAPDQPTVADIEGK
ncbi:unnamed protein product, partial [Chrysoparadoxa australica]